MILLSLHCRNSEALRCSVLQTGSVVYGSLSITSFESVINQSELCVQILDACLTHARKHHRDPCRLSSAGSLSLREPARRLEKFNFPRANAILARAQALLWVRDWFYSLFCGTGESE